jgi:hypothetical protein
MYLPAGIAFESFSSLLVSKSGLSHVNSTPNCWRTFFHTKRIRWLGNVDQLKGMTRTDGTAKKRLCCLVIQVWCAAVGIRKWW